MNFGCIRKKYVSPIFWTFVKARKPILMHAQHSWSDYDAIKQRGSKGMNIYFFSLDFVKWGKNHPRVALRAFRIRDRSRRNATQARCQKTEKRYTHTWTCEVVRIRVRFPFKKSWCPLFHLQFQTHVWRHLSDFFLFACLHWRHKFFTAPKFKQIQTFGAFLLVLILSLFLLSEPTN